MIALTTTLSTGCIVNVFFNHHHRTPLLLTAAGYQASAEEKPSTTQGDTKPEVKPHVKPSPATPGQAVSVFFSNLQWWTTDVEIEGICSEHGPVLAVRFIEDKACGKSRGMAVVDVASLTTAQAIIAGVNG